MSLRIFSAFLIIPLFLSLLLGAPGALQAQQATTDATPTAQPLVWTAPVPSAVGLTASASVANDIATYVIYPTNETKSSVWDLQIGVPLPAGATFLAAGAPAPFVTSFDGEKVIFSTPELAASKVVLPLRFQFSLAEVTSPLATTRATATWKAIQTYLGQSLLAPAESNSGDIMIQPHVPQEVVADMSGDVPFGDYDLTGLTFQQEQALLKITFYTAGNLGPVGKANELLLYIDNDCNADTGRLRSTLGLDYRVRYQHLKSQANLSNWVPALITATATITAPETITVSNMVSEPETGQDGTWRTLSSLSVESPPDGKSVTIWVPHVALADSSQFCWLLESQDRSNAFTPAPPKDLLPNDSNQAALTQYSAWATGGTIRVSVASTATLDVAATEPVTVSNTITEIAKAVRGKLAVPLINAQGDYDVHIFTLPAQTTEIIPNAGQPVFRPDGRQLLISRTSTETSGLFAFDLAKDSEAPVRDLAANSSPFYSPDGTWLVYVSDVISNTGAGAELDPLFWRCNVAAGDEAAEEACTPIPQRGVRSPVKQANALQGIYPVWTTADQIVYQGCAAWFAPDACGLYMMPAVSNDEPFTLRRLTYNPTDLPTDAKDDFVALMAQNGSNWEVYVMRLDGTWVRNVSLDSTAQDGLPVLSPDGQWIAFVSNRGGDWAVWGASLLQGEAQKLFDLPGDTPWMDESEGAWSNQRLSWAR